MKKFSKVYESVYGNNLNPGNDLAKTGVSNHYTPVENIITNINNLFCTRLSIVAMKGEDNVSIKLTSSKFVNEIAMNDLLYMPLYNDAFSQSSLYNYIVAQGLTKVTKLNLGPGSWVVYFSPNDIKIAKDPITMAMSNPKVTEESLNEIEFNLDLIKEDDGEEEMKDVTLEKFLELIESKDKVKAAKQLETLVAQQIELPREYYFAAIKFKTGEEAIALRWKYTKKLPTGQSTESVRSIMHIFGKGDKAIWVQDYDKDSIVQLPDDVKKLIDNILEMIEADKTDDPAIFKLTGEHKEREEKKKDDENDNEDEEDKNKKEKDKSKDDEDDEEDDDSRGEDDFLG